MKTRLLVIGFVATVAALFSWYRVSSRLDIDDLTGGAKYLSSERYNKSSSRVIAYVFNKDDIATSPLSRMLDGDASIPINGRIVLHKQGDFYTDSVGTPNYLVNVFESGEGKAEVTVVFRRLR